MGINYFCFLDAKMISFFRKSQENYFVVEHNRSINNSEIYVTSSPCYNCFKLIANSGIKTIYYDEFYRDDRIIKYADEASIELKALD